MYSLDQAAVVDARCNSSNFEILTNYTAPKFTHAVCEHLKANRYCDYLDAVLHPIRSICFPDYADSLVNTPRRPGSNARQPHSVDGLFIPMFC